nr:MAG TPA: hypothetical protein [Caudoviricetes sp.]
MLLSITTPLHCAEPYIPFSSSSYDAEMFNLPV